MRRTFGVFSRRKTANVVGDARMRCILGKKIPCACGHVWSWTGLGARAQQVPSTQINAVRERFIYFFSALE